MQPDALSRRPFAAVVTTLLVAAPVVTPATLSTRQSLFADSSHERVILPDQSTTTYERLASRVLQTRPTIELRATTGQPDGGARMAGWTEPKTSSSPARRAMLERLAEIDALVDGWLGPASRAVSPTVTALIKAALGRIDDMNVYVRISADPEGSVVMEWDRDGLAYTAQVFSDEMVLSVDDLGRGTTVGEMEREPVATALAEFVTSGRMR